MAKERHEAYWDQIARLGRLNDHKRSVPGFWNLIDATIFRNTYHHVCDPGLALGRREFHIHPAHSVTAECNSNVWIGPLCTPAYELCPGCFDAANPRSVVALGARILRPHVSITYADEGIFTGVWASPCKLTIQGLCEPCIEQLEALCTQADASVVLEASLPFLGNIPWLGQKVADFLLASRPTYHCFHCQDPRFS